MGLSVSLIIGGICVGGDLTVKANDLLIICNLYCSSTDFENPKVVNKMFGIFQGTAFIAGSTQQVD